MPIRILVAEDHTALRADLCALLEAEPDFAVVGEACDLGELLLLAVEARPDVMLLDIDLPGLHGFAMIRQIVGVVPPSRILLLAHELDAGLGRDAVLAGAAGCVVSQDAATTLAVGVRAVAQGRLFIEESVMRLLLADQQAQMQPPPCEALSPRELEVLLLLAQGHTNRQVAEALGLSARTVEAHRAKIQEQLGLRSRAELVRFVASKRLLERPIGGSEAQ